MRANPSKPTLTGALLLGCGVILLGGCSTDNLARTFGLTRDAPDEYTVTTRAPLSMPPNYNLRPPRPGTTRPQEQSERQQAEEALVPQMALNAPAGQATPSAGQTALMQETGPDAPDDIRAKIDQDANRANADDGFINKLLYWRKPAMQSVQVDAQKESQRLRENSALGEGPDVGTTPIIEQKKEGWFTSLFSWI